MSTERLTNNQSTLKLKDALFKRTPAKKTLTLMVHSNNNSNFIHSNNFTLNYIK